MWIAPVIALGMGAILVLTASPALLVAAPVLALWFPSRPSIACVDQPARRRGAMPNSRPRRRRSCAGFARKTWAFLETYVGEEDHWLPPDNYWEHPAPRIAHRTSPTNMGLSLLANLAAYDFGYIPAGQLLERTQNSINTMLTLGALRGTLLQLVRHARR